MKQLMLLALLFATIVPVAGCVVAPGPGWCYYHPYRCR